MQGGKISTRDRREPEMRGRDAPETQRNKRMARQNEEPEKAHPEESEPAQARETAHAEPGKIEYSGDAHWSSPDESWKKHFPANACHGKNPEMMWSEQRYRHPACDESDFQPRTPTQTEEKKPEGTKEGKKEISEKNAKTFCAFS